MAHSGLPEACLGGNKGLLSRSESSCGNSGEVSARIKKGSLFPRGRRKGKKEWYCARSSSSSIYLQGGVVAMRSSRHSSWRLYSCLVTASSSSSPFYVAATSSSSLRNALLGEQVLRRNKRNYSTAIQRTPNPKREPHKHEREPPKEMNHDEVIAVFESNKLLDNPQLVQVCKEFHPKYFNPQTPWYDDKLRNNKGQPDEEEVDRALMHTYSYLIALQLLSRRLAIGNQVLHVAVAEGPEIACIANLVTPYGHVHCITHEEDTIEFKRLTTALSTPQIASRIPPRSYSFTPVSNPLDGLPEQGPFDAIYVAKAVKAISPKWIAQLKPGGLMTVPLLKEGGKRQELVLVEKGEEGSHEELPLDEVGVLFEVLWV